MSDVTDDTKARRLLLMIRYEGPWERLQNRVLRAGDGTRLSPYPDGHWRWKVAGWLERRDYDWRNRHVALQQDPHPRWRRG